MPKRHRKRGRLRTALFPVPFAGAAIMLCVLALGYVWLGCRCETIGENIALLEAEEQELNEAYLGARRQWARMTSPRSLEIALQRHGLVMDWPLPGQVVHLQRPALSDMFSPGMPDGIEVAHAARYSGYE